MHPDSKPQQQNNMPAARNRNLGSLSKIGMVKVKIITVPKQDAPSCNNAYPALYGEFKISGLKITGEIMKNINHGGKTTARFVLLAAVSLLILCGHAQAQTCWNDKVRNSAGDVLALSSGQVFRVYPGASRITSMWLPLDKLTVCPIGGTAVEITNISQKNQQIKALRSN